VEDEVIRVFRQTSMGIARDFGADINPEVKAKFKSLTTKYEIAKYRDELIKQALKDYEETHNE
jgi:hypothetical protein